MARRSRPATARARARARPAVRKDGAEGAYLGRSSRFWIAALGRRDPLMRRLAAHALGQIGPAAGAGAIPALVRATEDQAAYVRVWAAAALARVAPRHARALPTLEAAMSHEAAFVRSLAAWHLGRVGAGLPDLRTAVARLEALVTDPDPSARTEAAVALKLLRSEPVRQRG